MLALLMEMRKPTPVIEGSMNQNDLVLNEVSLLSLHLTFLTLTLHPQPLFQFQLERWKAYAFC